MLMRADNRKFFEYNNGIINEMAQADVSIHGENIFLIYANDTKEALSLAMRHIYQGKPKSNLYDIDYLGCHYDVVYGVISD